MDIKLVQKLLEEDLFAAPGTEEVAGRKIEKDKADEAYYNSFKLGDKVKLAWLDEFGWSDIGTVVSKGKDYVPDIKYAIYVEFPQQENVRYKPYTYEDGKPLPANDLIKVESKMAR